MGEKDGLCGQAAPNRRKCLHSALSYKRMEKGRFIWPMAATGTVSLSAAQLAMLLEGIDWRAPVRSWRPELAG
ncbi:MAG: IS66 family insertion sequence element accessory protein TnpB [Methylocella sp.]